MTGQSTKACATALLAALALATPAAGAVTQPRQPKRGPGGSAYTHAAVHVTAGGSGNDAWYLFEPARPRPAGKVPLAIVTHGYYSFSGYDQMKAFIVHTVRKGTAVIYTRWQTSVISPCPGPFDIEPCMTSEVKGIRGALAYLRAHRSHVQPDLTRTSYFGFSFGGIITANLANRWKKLGMPKPRVVFLDDPHDGGLNGDGETALDNSLAGIPPTTLVQCHSGSDGVLSNPSTDPARAGETKDISSCNAVFPKLTSVPAANKDLVLTATDSHGTPALSSGHGVCAGPNGGAAAIDAYDWGFCWKVWDALRSCAFERRDCRYALGNTPEHRYIGTWSDGVPIIGLKVRDTAPIRATPVAARQARPATRGAARAPR